MSFRNKIALSVTLLLCIGTTAHAGQYAATDLGRALPMWMEALADLNDDGDVAWTSWTGVSGPTMPAGTHSAQYYLEGQAVGPASLPDTRASSWAVGVSPRVTDDGYTVIGIAGSDATHPRMTDRRALLWSVRLSGTPDINTVPLDIDIALESATEEPVQQSAAYGIVPRGGANAYYVGGFARKRVADSVLPKPVIWTVTGAHDASPTVTADALASLGGNSGRGNGYVSSIADNSGTIWACGNSSGATGAYVQATCWNISSGPSHPLAAADATITNALTAEYGAGNVATSMVNRVRVLPIGPSGANHTVAIGSAMVSGQWVGWAYNLNTGAFWDNLNIASNAETLAYDAAAIQYAEEGGGAASYGLMMGGVSRSVSGAPDILGGGPASVTTGVLRGVERRMLLNGVINSDDGAVCEINDDSTTQAAQYDQLLALSSDGEYRLAMADGQLVRLSEVDVSGVAVDVNQRRYTVQQSTRGSVQLFEYFYAFANENVEEAVLRVSDALGCDAPSFSGACNTNDPVAFDIAAHANGDIALSNVGSTLRSAEEAGSFPTGQTFAQLALRNGANCSITPVKATVVEAVNPAEDYAGDTTPWTQCSNAYSDYNTDISEDVRHCGGCGTSVQALTCSDNICDNGNPVIGTVDSGMCAIGPGNNSWACYEDGDRNPNQTTTAYHRINTRNSSCGNRRSYPNYRDPCSVCDSSQSSTAWSTSTNAMCCTGGTARLDAYDRDQNHCGNTAWSYDRNDGRVRRARWRDPRGGWVYIQNDDWSSGGGSGATCYANGSGDPHVITDPGTVNGGYARPRRIDAFFTHPIDTEDWYEASFDDDGDGQPTPKPRARLISRKTYPGTSRRVRMQLCLYVDVANGDRGHVDIKDMRANAGINKTTTQNAPSYSPAHDAKGQCVDTDDSGRADIVVYDYDNTRIWNGAKEDAYVHFVVRPLDDISELDCEGSNYTLYYGNDKRAGTGAQSGYNAGKTGCLDCCD